MAPRKKTEGPKRAALYVRVSHRNQVEGGHSLQAQREELEQYCERQGWTVAAVYTDAGRSAREGKERPELRRMLAEAAGEPRPFDVVLAVKLDRLGRSVKDLWNIAGTLHGHGIDLAFTKLGIDTSTPAGRMFFTMLGGIAEFESEMIGERIRDGLAVARAEHVKLGTAPFGMRRVPAVRDSKTRRMIEPGRLVPEPREQETLARIRELRAQGAGYLLIAKTLSREGRYTRGGGEWSAGQVMRAIRRMES